jgi:hypothetical protein
MGISRPFAYNPIPPNSPISGTTQTGDLAVGVLNEPYTDNYGGVIWWNGPDEELGYVITVPVSSNTQPTPIPGVFASVGFWRSTDLTEGSFVELTNTVFNQNFTNGNDASIWLTNNGYWNSWVSITPTPTNTQTPTVTPTPTLTPSVTSTQTPTNTVTPTNTNTNTPTVTSTQTPTQTLTPTTTTTPTPTQTPQFFLLFEDSSIATAENNNNIEIDII